MTSIKLKKNNFSEVINNKLLVEIIEKIISSYPITLIDLERLRKDIDTLDELFWIMNEEGKYLLVNNKFASNLNLTSSQIEGKVVENFIPAYLIKFNKVLNDYIRESRSVFVIEGFPLSGIPISEDFQTVEIPVSVSGSLVNAIIGVAQKTEKKSEEPLDSVSLSNMFKPFVENYILIGNDDKIKETSRGFLDKFSLKEDEIKNNHFKKYLPVSLINVIEDFKKLHENIFLYELKDSDIFEDEVKVHLAKCKGEEILLIIETKNKAEVSSLSLNIDDKVHDIILENTPDPVFIYDKENLRFLHVNNAAQKLYGYRKDEFLQLDLTDLYAPEDIQTLLEASEEKFMEGIYSKPYRQKRKDGKIIYVEINRKAVSYKNNQAYFNIIRDVSDKVNLEKESQLFNSFFENSDNLIFITDKEGFIQSVNNAVIETLGYSAKSLQQTSFAALLIDDDRGKINSSVFQGVSREKQILHTSIKKAGNEFLQAKLIITPVFDFKGDVEEYNLICFVMEERIKEVVKEIIKEVPVQVNYGEELKSTPDTVFLSGVFHDLLTPINVITGFVQEFIGNIAQPSAEQNEIIQILNLNRMNLLDTMNQAVEYIQIEKQKVDLDYSSVRIIDIIEDLEKDIIKNKILENSELAYGKISSSLEVKTDRQKLQRFLTLLLQIMNKSTSLSKLYVSVFSSNGNKFIISIKDGYSAASENFLEKLNSIFKDEGKISPKEIGISLLTFGLCKGLLRLLGGAPVIINEKGKKDLAFIFPLDLEAEKSKYELKEEQLIQEEIIIAEEIIDDSSKEQESVQEEKMLAEDISLKDSKPGLQSDIDLTQLRCLYIEDQLDSQILFSMQMKELKEIYFAVSFEQALPLLRDKEFDFIVVDINLQGDYNGIDILRIIRTVPEYENIPIVAVSAYLLPGDNEMFIKSGFSDFIAKPIFKERLLNSLERILFAHT